MTVFHRIAAALLFVAYGLGAAAPASAQVRYTCRDEAGNSFASSRPCPAGTRTATAVAGPAASSYSAYSAGSGTAVRLAAEEPEHFRYLNERCRSLYQAMRSGRNMAADVQEGMRREYRRDCDQAESDASSRLHRERREARKQAQDEEKQGQAARQAAQEQAARNSAQCAESRRIIEAKRKRTDLTDGERADLRRFEDNVAVRCSG